MARTIYTGCEVYGVVAWMVFNDLPALPRSLQ